MVGKPNFPDDFEFRTDIKGAAMTTPGLDALDQEREASMADEGGTSGAFMETQEVLVSVSDAPAKKHWAFTFYILLGIAGVGLILRRFKPY